MTVVCVLVEGAETRAQNDSLQHAYQIAPVCSLPPFFSFDSQFDMLRDSLAPPVWAELHDFPLKRQKTWV